MIDRPLRMAGLIMASVIIALGLLVLKSRGWSQRVYSECALDPEPDKIHVSGAVGGTVFILLGCAVAVITWRYTRKDSN
jgi:hypothetical protein